MSGLATQSTFEAIVIVVLHLSGVALVWSGTSVAFGISRAGSGHVANRLALETLEDWRSQDISAGFHMKILI
jgi:hypothetical protein